MNYSDQAVPCDCLVQQGELLGGGLPRPLTWPRQRREGPGAQKFDTVVGYIGSIS